MFVFYKMVTCSAPEVPYQHHCPHSRVAGMKSNVLMVAEIVGDDSFFLNSRHHPSSPMRFMKFIPLFYLRLRLRSVRLDRRLEQVLLGLNELRVQSQAGNGAVLLPSFTSRGLQTLLLLSALVQGPTAPGRKILRGEQDKGKWLHTDEGQG